MSVKVRHLFGLAAIICFLIAAAIWFVHFESHTVEQLMPVIGHNRPNGAFGWSLVIGVILLIIPNFFSKQK